MWSASTRCRASSWRTSRRRSAAPMCSPTTSWRSMPAGISRCSRSKSASWAKRGLTSTSPALTTSNSGELFPERRSRLVQPERVVPNDIVDAEVVVGVMPLHIVIPDVVDLFPGHREHRRVLFHNGFGLPHQCQALGGIDLAVDLVDQIVEFLIVPERIILRPAGAIPRIEIIRRHE